jgi:hypothetical protein
MCMAFHYFNWPMVPLVTIHSWGILYDANASIGCAQAVVSLPPSRQMMDSMNVALFAGAGVEVLMVMRCLG